MATNNFLPTIFLMDNGSNNNSASILTCYLKKFPLDNKLSISNRNLGYVSANNQLMQAAIDDNYDYICLLNNDTRVEKDFLQILIRECNGQPLIAGAGGKIYFEHGYEPKNKSKTASRQPTIWYAGGPLKLTEIYPENRGYGEIDVGMYDRKEETEFISGCLFLIKASVLKEVGLFDNRYYHSYEDVDLSLRINKAGYKLLYCPESVIWHLGSVSSGRDTDFIKYFTDRNAWLYVATWSPLRTKLSLTIDFVRIIIKGSYWEKMAVIDFLRKNFGKGSWPEN